MVNNLRNVFSVYLFMVSLQALSCFLKHALQEKIQEKEDVLGPTYFVQNVNVNEKVTVQQIPII